MEAEFQIEFDMKVCNGFIQQHNDFSVIWVFLFSTPFLTNTYIHFSLLPQCTEVSLLRISLS